MPVAKVSEIVSELTKTTALSLDEAIQQGIAGENRTLRNVRVWWIKEERVRKGSLTEVHVSMRIGFIIDDWARFGFRSVCSSNDAELR